MVNAHLVLLTADVDCDGTAYGAQRVTVPAHRALEFKGDFDALRAHVVGSEQSSYGLDMTYDVLTMAEFLATFTLDSWDYAYFAEVGYTSGHMAPRWNPWVADDTIGIPALDSRWDD